MRTLGLTALLAAALAGCAGVPEGYRRVRAEVEPRGRPVAIVPFAPVRDYATVVEGIRLAELAAMELQAALPELKVLGPSAMQEALAGGMDESRWNEIGRSVGVELLVVGQIMFFQTQFDEQFRLREGSIKIKFRILDVSGFPPKELTRVNWWFGYPEDTEAKFSEKYVSMDEMTFRGEVIKFAARRVAGTFYDHLEQKKTDSQREVRWYKE